MAEAQLEIAHPPLTDAGPRYLNRELSHLSFDERVLALAEDSSLPLLERIRFLAILSQNLDEFYQVRVAGLKEQQAVVPPPISPDGLTPGEQLSA
ncbi:MAG TPA: RNA degradosome polyphosphate kinase, partial [Candidatus Dormibacteraeota bacterium]|nr:RNA degradosome polyphosphate kinase [Candidatus Dormibacteraeota bacterium]